MRNRTWQLAAAAVLGIAVAGILNLTGQSQETGHPGHDTAKVTKAVAVVHALGDNQVKGKVTFTQQDSGVEIVAEISGLTPGEHGFHVHEFGDCSMADGVCAGGHWNPTGEPHGGPTDAKRHAGDLGNLTADQAGHAIYERVDKHIMLNGPNSIIGRSVIIHADRDDLTSQPSGNAGARIGCGVIGIADPKMEH